MIGLLQRVDASNSKVSALQCSLADMLAAASQAANVDEQERRRPNLIVTMIGAKSQADADAFMPILLNTLDLTCKPAAVCLLSSTSYVDAARAAAGPHRGDSGAGLVLVKVADVQENISIYNLLTSCRGSPSPMHVLMMLSRPPRPRSGALVRRPSFRSCGMTSSGRDGEGLRSCGRDAFGGHLTHPSAPPLSALLLHARLCSHRSPPPSPRLFKQHKKIRTLHHRDFACGLSVSSLPSKSMINNPDLIAVHHSLHAIKFATRLHRTCIHCTTSIA